MFKRDKLTTSKKQYALYWVMTGLFIIYALLLLYPFLWAFLCSFMQPREYVSKIGQFLPMPDKLDFSNYVQALKVTVLATDKYGVTMQYDIPSMILTTLLMTVMRTLIGMAFPVCSAYCVAKYKFVGAKFYFFYGVVFCSVPFYGGISAIFKWIYRLGLYDTVGAIMILSINSFGGFLFYLGFFRGISWEYAESAFIDGASDLRVFWTIMLPNVMPLLFTFCVSGFIANWNDWMTNYMYLPSKPMIAYGIYQFSIEAEVSGEWNTLYAALFASLTVPLTLFLIFHKRILATVYTGGLKG